MIETTIKIKAIYIDQLRKREWNVTQVLFLPFLLCLYLFLNNAYWAFFSDSPAVKEIYGKYSYTTDPHTGVGKFVIIDPNENRRGFFATKDLREHTENLKGKELFIKYHDASGLLMSGGNIAIQVGIAGKEPLYSKPYNPTHEAQRINALVSESKEVVAYYFVTCIVMLAIPWFRFKSAS